MQASTGFRGGRNIAMKVPTHQFEPTVRAYRLLGIPIERQSSSSVVFEFGPMRLHVDRVSSLSQAEIWLEFITPDVIAAGDLVAEAGFVRCDDIEALPPDFAGFWVSSPASIVHLVSDSE